jgi:allantoate deiminase
MSHLSAKILSYCEGVAACTEEPGRITRAFLSPPMHVVHDLLGSWMRGLGMTVWTDAAGNLRGLRGTGDRRLIIGSHLDTVPNAGAYDGVLGVILGIALVEALGPSRPDLSIEVIGFSEEEGVRFGVPFIGSRALVGTLDEGILTAGVKEAVREFGLDPAQIPDARFDRCAVGYLEIHIEQGPVLDDLGIPLAVVERIAGQSRLNLTFTGRANHAGTTPMHLRRDALTAAAEWIAFLASYASKTEGLVATAGSIHVEPNASNVISEVAKVSLDVRHGDDRTRHDAVAALLASAAEICRTHNIGLTHEVRLDQAAVPMDTRFSELLAASIEEAGYPVHRMVSGAGHDAMIVAPFLPSAMLFLRSPGGVSHHPDEAVHPGDIDAALKAALNFLDHV